MNTVRQLVEKADGLMGDAFTARAVLHRERDNLTREVISVDIKKVLDGTIPDIPLQKNDVLYIPSIHDLQDMGVITVFGEVARPGELPYADNTTLEDIIIQSRLLPFVWMSHAVSRTIRVRMFLLLLVKCILSL